MKILKGFALVILGVILFISLTVFSAGLTVKTTALSPDFIVRQINQIDIAALGNDIFTSDQGFPPELADSLNKTLIGLEPQLKTQLGFAIHSVYEYLNGKKANPELVETLRNTVISQGMIASVIDNVDMSGMVTGMIQQQFDIQMPQDIPADAARVIKENLGSAIKKAEPQIKEQLKSASGPLMDYIFGKSNTFDVSITLGPMLKALEDEVKAALLKSPPQELAAVPVNQRSQYIDDFFGEFTKNIPLNFTIDQRMIGTDVKASIAEGIKEAETGLTTGKLYVGYINTCFNLVIVLLLLTIAGIAFIHNSVKGATRSLGITLLVFGIIEFASLFMLKNFAASNLITADLPGNLSYFIPTLVSDVLKPVQLLNIGFMVGGAILIVVSFIYRARLPSTQPA